MFNCEICEEKNNHDENIIKKNFRKSIEVTVWNEEIRVGFCLIKSKLNYMMKSNSYV